MRPLSILGVLCLFLLGANWGSDYQNDLISKGRLDSNVKYLTPPMSLTVVENRPARGTYFFEGDPSSGQPDLARALGDPKSIKRTLLKTDPARLVPARQGEDFFSPVTRDILLGLGKSNPADLLLIFRRKVKGNPEQGRVWTIKTQGLIYINKQKKILSLQENSQSGMNAAQLSENGLKILAQHARKVIQAQKKIITHSY